MTRVDMFVAAMIQSPNFARGNGEPIEHYLEFLLSAALTLDKRLADEELKAMTPPPGFVAQKETIKQICCDCGSFDISQAPGGFFKCGNCKKIFRDLVG